MLLHPKDAIIISSNQGTEEEQRYRIQEMIEEYVNFEGSHHGEIPQSQATPVVPVYFEEEVRTELSYYLPAAEATPVPEDTTTGSSPSDNILDGWTMVNDPEKECVVCSSTGELFRTEI